PPAAGEGCRRDFIGACFSPTEACPPVVLPSGVCVQEGGPEVIVVGIDPHKQTHTAVAVDAASGRVLAELTVKAREPGFERLVEWARELDPERTFAVEDGRHVSGQLE